MSVAIYDAASATRRRKSKPPFSTPFFRVTGLILLLAQYQSLAKAANQYGECYRHMYAADQAGNQDLFLNLTEFQDSVRRITFGAVTTLSAPLGNVFNIYQNGNGAIWVSGVEPNAISSDPTKTSFLNQVCDDVYKAILTTLGKTPNYDECKLWMSIGDRVTGAKNDRLEKLREFPIFANRMTGDNLYTNDVTFAVLPPPVQLVFGDFENPDDPGMIHITGAWLSPGKAIEPAQKIQLENLCRQTMVAIEAGKVVLALPTTVPFPAPSLVPTTAPSLSLELIDFSLETCFASMVQSDTVIDNLLTQPEYVGFLNRLTDDRYPNFEFKNLPPRLQQIYAQKAAAERTNGVSIQGARYGSTRTPQTMSALETFCNSTKLALNGKDPSFTPVPTMVPAPAPPPGIFYIPFADCTLAMATSEIDGPTNTLDQEEYVLFLNKATTFQFFRDYDFSDLPKPLVDNYNVFEDYNRQGIPIDGSYPGTFRSPEQNNKLLAICLATSAAIGQAIYSEPPPPTPRTTPVPAPTTSAPVATTSAPVRPTWQPTNAGTVTVYNAFVVSNTAGLGITDLTTGNTSNQLRQGYSNFISKVVNDLVSGSFLGGENRQLRSRLFRARRKLPWTGIVAGSASLYEIEEYPCPLSVKNITRVVCHAVFGSFDASFVNEGNTVALAASLSQWIQNTVMRANGGLGSFVNSTVIVVEGEPSNGRVRPADMTTPTSAPDSSFDTKNAEDGDQDEDSGLSTSLFVGIIVAGAVVCCCCCAGVFIWQATGSGRPRDLKMLDDASQDSEGFVKQEGPLPDRRLRGPSSTKLSTALERKTEESKNPHDRDEFSLEEEHPPPRRSSGSKSGSEKTSNVFGAFFGLGARKKDQSDEKLLGPVAAEDDVESRRGLFADQKAESTNRSRTETGRWDPVEPGSSRVKWALATFADKENSDVNGTYAKLDQSNDNLEQEDESEEFLDEIISDSEEEEEVVDEFIDEDVIESDSDTYKGDGGDSYMSQTRDEKSVGTVRQFDSMIDKGDWDGIIDNAKRLEGKNDDADSYIQRQGSIGLSSSAKSNSEESEEEESESGEEESESEEEESESEEEESESEEEEDDEDETLLFTTTGSRTSNDRSKTSSGVSQTSEERRTREAYRAKVKDLISKVVPNEANNVDSMMLQFKGREEELIQTLENMYQRSSGVRGQKPVGSVTSMDMASDIEHSHSEFGYDEEATDGHENHLLVGDDDDDEEDGSPSVYEDDEADESEDIESEPTVIDYGYEPAEPTVIDYGYENPDPVSPTPTDYEYENPDPTESSHGEEEQEEEVSYDEEHVEEEESSEEEEEEESYTETSHDDDHAGQMMYRVLMHSTKDDEDEVVRFDVVEHNESQRKLSETKDDVEFTEVEITEVDEEHIGHGSGHSSYEDEEAATDDDDDNEEEESDDDDGNWG